MMGGNVVKHQAIYILYLTEKCSTKVLISEGGDLAEVVTDALAIEAGENYIAVYVDCSRGVGQSIVAEMEMDLTGPVTADVAQPRTLSGFELPALELLHLAQERAGERGVKKILLVDPQGFLRLARTNRYARR